MTCNITVGREPWSSGNMRRLKIQRLWVRIPAPYTGWTFFTYVFVVMCFWKDENKWKRGRGCTNFFKKHPIRGLYFSIAHLCYTKICLWHWLHGLPLLCSAHFMNFLIESGSNFHKYSITDGTNPMALIPTIKWGFCEVGVCKIKLFLLPRYNIRFRR